MYHPSYAVRTPKYWHLRDKPISAGLLFHIQENDYFATLATIMKFYQEAIQGKDTTPEMRKLDLDVIQNVTNDLMYLHKNFTIIPKENSSCNAAYF